MVDLPTEKSKKNLDFKAQKFGMIGVAGIGKSEFWAQDPKAFFIEAEAGLNFLEVFKIPVRNWDDVRNVYALLKAAEKDGKFPYEVLIVDTIDRIIDYAEEEILMKAREFYTKIADQLNTIGDIPNGAGWSKTKDKVMNLMKKLEELPCAVVYIGHLINKLFEDGVRKYHKSTINVGGKLGLQLLAWPDHTLHVEAMLVGDKLTRTVWTKPTQSREAKSRGGAVPNGMRWTENMKENYDTFRKLFK